MTQQLHPWVGPQNKNLHMNVHSSPLHNGQKVDQPKCQPPEEGINQMRSAHAIGMVFSHEKEWSIDSCSDEDGPRKHDAP